MLTVFKYPIGTSDRVEINARIVRILSVQVQQGTPCVWAMVDPDKAGKCVQFVTVGTGHPMPPEASRMAYVGTYQLAGGSLVFHVFTDYRESAPIHMATEG